jgi:hypothetical protein
MSRQELDALEFIRLIASGEIHAIFSRLAKHRALATA